MEYRSRRHLASRDVTLEMDGAPNARGHLMDVSEGGAKVAVDAPPPPGTPVRLEVGRLKLAARAVWSARGEVGLRFDAPLARATVEEVSGKPYARAKGGGGRWMYGG